MSESIAEMIIPGTYIEVRAEGLIGVGGISTGTIGIVGTANRGPLDQVVTLGSFAEALEIFGDYDPWPNIAPATPATTAHLTLTRTLEQAFRGGASDVLAVRVANLAPNAEMRSMTWTIAGAAGDPIVLTATTPGTWANGIVAKLTLADAKTPTRLTLTKGARRETFESATLAGLAQEINDGSTFVTASSPAEDDKDEAPTTLAEAAEAERGGPDGAGAMGSKITQIDAGLALLADHVVNILIVAGYNADAVSGAIIGHLESTETNGRERIAILGTRGDEIADAAADIDAISNRRAVLVAPGILSLDRPTGKMVELPAAYAAALVAGRLSTLAPHVSLTNKDVAVDGLTKYYTRAEQKQLLGNRIMTLHRNLGFRALRGITTDDGPFIQISVRRIVDFAKAGVRVGSNPYIGRLNNARVRSALKATLDGFLSQMVIDEMLIGYDLEVGATRAQEIAGVAAVTMTLRPTFSIDFIRVTMNLE
jgi:hypothetical protein